MAIRDDLHTLVDTLSEDEAAAALAYVRGLARNQDQGAHERFALRMGPAAVAGEPFMTGAASSLAILAATQGVEPVARPHALYADIWPSDPEEDPDLFGATLKQWRRPDADA